MGRRLAWNEAQFWKKPEISPSMNTDLSSTRCYNWGEGAGWPGTVSPQEQETEQERNLSGSRTEPNTVGLEEGNQSKWHVSCEVVAQRPHSPGTLPDDPMTLV